MKKWKEIYELFKKCDNLDEKDMEFISISEKMLATKNKYCKKIVYSELWLSNWIKTTQCRLFVTALANSYNSSNIIIIGY